MRGLLWDPTFIGSPGGPPLLDESSTNDCSSAYYTSWDVGSLPAPTSHTHAGRASLLRLILLSTYSHVIDAMGPVTKLVAELLPAASPWETILLTYPGAVLAGDLLYSAAGWPWPLLLRAQHSCLRASQQSAAAISASVASASVKLAEGLIALGCSAVAAVCMSGMFALVVSCIAWSVAAHYGPTGMFLMLALLYMAQLLGKQASTTLKETRKNIVPAAQHRVRCVAVASFGTCLT